MIEYAISEIGTYVLSGKWYATREDAEAARLRHAPYDDLFQIIELHFDDLEKSLPERRAKSVAKLQEMRLGDSAVEHADRVRIMAGLLNIEEVKVTPSMIEGVGRTVDGEKWDKLWMEAGHEAGKIARQKRIESNQQRETEEAAAKENP